MQNSSLENRFVVAVLCPDASFGHLLAEAQRNNLTVLEMIPYREHLGDLHALSRGMPVLFIYGEGKSKLATSKTEIEAGILNC